MHYYNASTTIPMGLLVLCTLCYIGRGWTLDNIQEDTAIGGETACTFIHKLIAFGSNDLYHKYVNSPENLNELNDCERVLLCWISWLHRIL